MAARHCRIDWRPKAREGLRTIVRYVGKGNLARAGDIATQLRDRTRAPAQHPQAGHAGGWAYPAAGANQLVYSKSVVSMASWPRTAPCRYRERGMRPAR
ncbi:type II toxin-antitoxin system RelE/ParE family toxin [Accumulibacter sp.]|uniref:type II toxin-antitoxin system RelE/ParE family toxin n=1 Tax=Accumulibacter sp. TaxID=2053492 RepID=UPI0034181E4F